MKGSRKTTAAAKSGDVKGYSKGVISSIIGMMTPTGGMSNIDTAPRTKAESDATKTNKQVDAAAARPNVQVSQVNFRCDSETEALIEALAKKLGMTNAKGATLTSAVLRHAVHRLAKLEGVH